MAVCRSVKLSSELVLTSVPAGECVDAAQYALLPGAYLVEPQRTIMPTHCLVVPFKTLDNSVVAGNRGIASTDFGDG